MPYRIQTLQPKSSVRSPAKTVPKTAIKEEKMSAPYIRKLSKKEKEKWTTDDEGTALCDMDMHEVSIVASNKDDISTAV